MTSTGAGFSAIPDLHAQVPPREPRSWTEKALTAQFWTYRLGAYLMLNVVEDPAWLALIFC
jgi:hypothetical protein